MFSVKDLGIRSLSQALTSFTDFALLGTQTAPLQELRWRVSDWSQPMDEEAFSLKGNVLSMKQAGIYFIYSQVTFYSIVKEDDYKILINGQPFITCRSSQQVDLTQ